MTEADREERVARYRAWETEELIRAVRFDWNGYTPEALALIEEELAARNHPVVERRDLEVVAADLQGRDLQRLTGIKGWLLLLVLIILINSSFALFGAAKSLRHPPPVEWAFAFLTGGFGLFGLATFVLLLTKHRLAPEYAKALFLLAMTISLLQAFYFKSPGWFPSFPLADTMQGGVFWIAYLSVSKRVKMTYGSA
ncbi:MAG: DUF2569 family protein [Acidobacteriota bacterium]